MHEHLSIGPKTISWFLLYKMKHRKTHHIQCLIFADLSNSTEENVKIKQAYVVFVGWDCDHGANMIQMD